MTESNGPWGGRPSAHALNGMVATPHHLASAAGVRMLRGGGSAVDAAVAANAVLCVAYPHMAGVGGDGFWLVHHPDEGQLRALDASGASARLADRAYYLDRGHPDDIPVRGGLAALTVPGAVDGWREAHQRYGRLEWRALFDDAVRYARDGMPASRSLADWLPRNAKVLGRHAATARIFLPHGRAPREGERFVQRDLAATLEEMARHGARDGFYDGALAGRICAALEPLGSPLRPDDFASHRAEWVAPLSTRYRRHDVYGLPPPTQGFAALQILNLLEGFDLRGLGDGSAEYYHLLVEASKVAFADRDEWLADPRFVDIPLDRLLSQDYADARRALIQPERALPVDEVLPGLEFTPAGGAADAGRPARRSPSGDTVAFSAVDRDGLVVSCIQSIYHDFGSGIVAGDSGVLMQNRGVFFSLDERHANRLEPNKKPFHTLMPGMVLREGKPLLALGSMGGEGQPQTHAALVTRLVDFGLGVQEAIDAPRWLMGRTWGAASKSLSLEGRIPEAVARGLERRGHPVKVVEDWDDAMGHAQAIRIDPATGTLEGGADPRGDGAALGY